MLYQVVELIYPVQGISVITLKPLETALMIAPGQYVYFHLDEEKFPFSIAEQRADSSLVFHLRHGALHPQAEALLEHLKTVGRITLSGPFGKCVLPKAALPCLFIAGGTGISPHQALINHALSLSFKQIELYWGLKNHEDCYLEAWLKQLPSWLPVHLVMSEQAHSTHPQGWVHDYALSTSALLQDEQSLIYVSGPYPMVQTLKQRFDQLGISRTRIFCDMLD
jgi:NAD(P)H-flavin reductase